jgi:molybdenum cofactor cytidylyltransferase
MPRVGAIVLAAGRSSRYRAAGGPEATKLVAEVAGKPIVRRVAEAALASRARPVVVVVGHARDLVEGALAGLQTTIVVNADFATGIASSLRAGLRATPPEISATLVLLGDMPNVEAGLIDRLIDAWEAAPGMLAVAPLQNGRRGNPVLLARPMFDDAMRLEGDEGARRLLAGLGAGRIVEIEASGEGAAFDVDTPDDLEAAGSRPAVDGHDGQGPI